MRGEREHGTRPRSRRSASGREKSNAGVERADGVTEAVGAADADAGIAEAAGFCVVVAAVEPAWADLGVFEGGDDVDAALSKGRELAFGVDFACFA